MSRIGLPLTTETGTPRVVPRTIPERAPAPDKAPAPATPLREPVPVGPSKQTPAEGIIHRAATTLGVPDEWVAAKVIQLADLIAGLMNVGGLGKNQTTRCAEHPNGPCVPPMAGNGS